MLPSAIIQLLPENNVTALERLKHARDTYVKIRDNLNEKMSMIDRAGQDIQEVEQAAEAILTWDTIVSCIS